MDDKDLNKSSSAKSAAMASWKNPWIWGRLLSMVVPVVGPLLMHAVDAVDAQYQGNHDDVLFLVHVWCVCVCVHYQKWSALQLLVYGLVS